jgi:hypothetical protein
MTAPRVSEKRASSRWLLGERERAEKIKKRIVSVVLLGALIGSNVPVNAQALSSGGDRSEDYWMKYTERLPIGSTLKIRTTDGKRMTAVLAIVDNAGITVEPKTRVPESPQVIPFNQLAQVELKDHGSSVAKAIAIGAGIGGATFLGLLLWALSAWD